MENNEMNVIDENRVLLSIKDLVLKFQVRGRVLTALRGISLDIYEGESIAIVGESGSGKSVFTKTFAGMNESNGHITNGSIIFNDEELSNTDVKNGEAERRKIASIKTKLDEFAKFELASETYNKIQALDLDMKSRAAFTGEEEDAYKAKAHTLNFKRTELHNKKQVLDPSSDKEKIRAISAEIKQLDKQLQELEHQKEETLKKHKTALEADSAYLAKNKAEKAALEEQYKKDLTRTVTQEQKDRNEILAKEVYLSVGRFPFLQREIYIHKLLRELKKAMTNGVDLADEEKRNEVFDNVTFRVKYLSESPEQIHGTAIINLAKVNYSKDWTQIRGKKIATVFQDPMTSLNPVLTVGQQITSVILKHQDVSEIEARRQALVLMKKVGIPDAENRFDDYPHQYSGGMRQRIVIAIALSSRPKILICDEPTTALDVTIQAQILELIKELQKEFKYTIVFITHDLGVVANIADRVAVLYSGEIVELGTVEEIFYEPKHPYTWSLLSSLPQLAKRGTELYSISGTPPSLYNEIVGEPFAPRNPYCLKIDTLQSPPVFQFSVTHFAKTWLGDPRAPKIEKPEIIHDITNKLVKAYNIKIN